MNVTLLTEGADAKVHILNGINSDSGLSVQPMTFKGIEIFEEKNVLCDDFFFHILSTSRVTKSDQEVIAMRYSAFVASNAHVQVMKSTKSGMNEYELEAKFLYEIYKNGGCRKAAYTSICACGPDNAILHYGK